MAGILIKDEVISKIIELYTSGLNCKTIAEILHISQSTVSKYLKLNNIKVYKNNEINKDIIYELKDLYENTDLTLEELSQAFHIKSRTISKHLKSYGVKIKNTIGLAYNFNQNKFEHIITEEDAYFLGLLYADGCISSNANLIVLGLQDLKMIEKFNSFMEASSERIKNVDPNFYKVAYSSSTLKLNLMNLGVYPKKSLILTCPSSKQVPDYLFPHFMRGYVDGDGHIDYRQYSPVIEILGTKEFLSDVQHRMNWTKKEIKLKPNSNIYRLRYYGQNEAFTYLCQLYKNSNIYLERKYKKFLTIESIMLSKIRGGT